MSDIGTTARGRLSRRDRLADWERHMGHCVICCVKIDGVREKWGIEHIRALELGGTDTPDNRGPAHLACMGIKTQDDHRRTAKAKRNKMRQIGIKKPSRGFRKPKDTKFDWHLGRYVRQG